MCPQNKDIPESQPILIRNNSIENKTKLQLNDWTSIMINEDPVTAFSSTLNNIYEDSFPLLESKPNKNKNTINPWFTYALQESQ